MEALSRGAREAVFVDAGKEPISIIEKNIASTGLGERAKVLHMDYAAFLLRRNEPFDIAFLDPPYRTGLLQKADVYKRQHLHVAEADMGRVIGKQGRIAKAIRVVMRAAATRTNSKISVEID